MGTIIVKQKAAGLIKKGSPLISQMDLAQELRADEGEVVKVYDQQRHFLGMAYVGFQNKGVAWVYSREEDEALDDAFFSGIFKTAFENRRALIHSEDTTTFRLFNGEGDGFGGVTIDWYDGFIVVSWYSEGVYHYRDLILTQALGSFEGVKGVYEKIRFKNKADLPESQFVGGVEAPEPLIVLENGVKYATYMNEGLMTGIFLDQREVRETIRQRYSAGRTVLNTFSYTGAFSVAAAMGGASKTTSVDVANRSLEKTKEQFAVNGIDPETQQIYVMDVFDYFKYAVKKQLKFDTVVVDPPSFARTKKRTFSVAKDYGKLVAQITPLVAPKGTLVLSTNAANVSESQFQQMIEKGIREAEGNRKFRIVLKKGLPSDFAVPVATPLSDYLKVFFIEFNN